MFQSQLYEDEQKNYPKYDFIIAAILAFIWLCASSAWANGILGLKSIADVESWIYDDDKNGPCMRDNGIDFNNVKVDSCGPIETSSGFGTGNSSVLFGFLNCFLWCCNTWFLYKETSWFRARNNQESVPGV